MSSVIRIYWYGHACIGIHAYNKILVIDPHDGSSIGLKRPEVKADIVLITHEHFDHNAYKVVSKPDTQVFRMREGDFEADLFRVRGVRTYHDKESGRRRGLNIVYVVRSPGGVSILHAGDLGHIPSKETLEKLERVDIAILPVGGTFTIDYSEALELFSLLKAKIMIPIHYWVPGVNLPLATIDNLIRRAREKNIDIVDVDKNYVELEDSPNKLPQNKIMILRYQ